MRVLLTLVALLALAVPSAAETTQIMRMDLAVPVQVGVPIPADAAHRRPISYSAGGDRSLQNHTALGVIKTLYDNATTVSAVSWLAGAPAGTQVFTMSWGVPVAANGCMAIANVRGTPALAGFRFRHQAANGVWSDWTEPMGEFNVNLSGNKAYEGPCGLSADSRIIALAVAPPETRAGEFWLREFRVSFNGVYAPATSNAPPAMSN